jgi:hypothetical protein
VKKYDISSAGLHILAMLFMLLDHLWATVVPGNEWMTCVGRLAFPIFAFLIAEGYFHTRNLKKYLLRLLVFALISEIPFNLAIGGRFFFPIHQNILWSFLISLWLIHRNERAKATGKLWRRILTGIATVALGTVLGLVTFVDYYHAGILTALVFYFFRGRKWWNYAGQALCLWYINTEVLGGLVYEFTLLGQNLVFHRQAFALLALIPIWLYRGRQGHHSKAFQYFCYGFYPLHLLILSFL